MSSGTSFCSLRPFRTILPVLRWERIEFLGETGHFILPFWLRYLWGCVARPSVGTSAATFHSRVAANWSQPCQKQIPPLERTIECTPPDHFSGIRSP